MADFYGGDDSAVERVKLSARVRKGRGFGDSRDTERLQYDSIEDTGGPGPMRFVLN